MDDLAKRLDALVAEQRAAGKKPLISYVESGTKDVHAFFEANKWLYADRKDLESAYDTLDFQIAVRSGLVPDLGEDDDEPAPTAAPAPASPGKGKQPALGLDEYRARWEAKAREHDDFPSGYFETPDGTMTGLRIVSFTTGMGDAGDDTLLGPRGALVQSMGPTSYQPAMKVGFAGDIPNAAAEKDSIVSNAAWASGFALVAIARRRRLVLPVGLVARSSSPSRRCSGSELPTRSRTFASGTSTRPGCSSARSSSATASTIRSCSCLAVSRVPRPRAGAGGRATRGRAERVPRGARRARASPSIAYGSLTSPTSAGSASSA